MYSPDTLQRVNEKRFFEHYKKGITEGAATCDYCDNPATQVIPVYNPADAMRTPPLKGAYAMVEICDSCQDKGLHLEENFYCDVCGEFFITHHSWDVVAATGENGEQLCQKCAFENWEPPTLAHLREFLFDGETSSFKRLNGVPGKKLLWEGEFSSYHDFSGYTRLTDVVDDITKAAVDADIDADTLVWPVIDHEFQFSVSLAVYY